MQQGMSMIALLAYLAIGGFIVLIGIRAIPMYSEYFAIVRIVEKIQSDESIDISGVKAEFSRMSSTEYITSIDAKDLEVKKTDKGVHISFSYEQRIDLVANVSLAFDFSKE